jgi:hypothetical protein
MLRFVKVLVALLVAVNIDAEVVPTTVRVLVVVLQVKFALAANMSLPLLY